MSNRTLAIDVTIALLATVVLVVVSPGLAIVGLIAILVLVVCGLSVVFERLRRGRRSARPAAAARRPPPRNPPPRRPPPRRPQRRS